MMITNTEIANGIRCFYCGHEARLLGNSLKCDSCKRNLADWFADEFRLDYNYSFGDLELRTRIEADIWDQKAVQSNQLRWRQYTPFEKWFGSYPVYKRVMRKHPAILNLESNRILQIGAAGHDMARMLMSGIKRLDHVEISSASQKSAQEELDICHIEWREKVFFHTVLAERLPFQDNTFDFIFARATVHHVKRPDIWLEMSRVLKPGGRVLLIEAMMHPWLLIMLDLWRRLLSADRGTDLPLTTTDIKMMSENFDEVKYYPFGILSALWLPTFGKLKSFASLTTAINKFELNVGNCFGLSHFLGYCACIVAFKRPNREKIK